MEMIDTNLLLQKFETLAASRQTSMTQDDGQLESYRKAAALLHSFVPAAINPLDPGQVHASPGTLLSDDMIAFAGGFGEGIYTLKPEVRNKALKSFSSRTAMYRGLKANPERIQTPQQLMWENYLRNGFFPDENTLTYDETISLYQLVTWLDGVHDKLPGKEALMILIGRRSVLANFEHLVISNFTGRKKELKSLRNHTTGKLLQKPILSVHGPGGIGKSALLGKALYDQANGSDNIRVPYVYLAFDQPSLKIENPVTIFNECAAQLELQYPQIPAVFSDYRLRIGFVSQEKYFHSSRRIITQSREKRINIYQGIEEELLFEFGRLLKKVVLFAKGNSKKQKHILITFDTFEEVQYRDRESLRPFGQMLASLIRLVPDLRILIASRMPVMPSLNITELMEEVSLSELEMEDRMNLLIALKVKNKKMIRMVAERVGGNPLSLRLAARALLEAQNEVEAGQMIPAEWMLSKVDAQLIQGQLYKRILNHIHNDDIRKLAHPGMILRKVTPDLIRDVLAPVCGIRISSPEQADKLFLELQKEHTLVKSDEPNTLMYRFEIREVMVKLLKQDKWEEVSELHEKAIKYYQDKKGVDARAEEMYHLLALGTTDTWQLDRRWMSGIEQSVVSTLSEYSDSMKAWLASRTSLEVPREVFRNADTEEWERNITRKVKQAMLNGANSQAFSLLKERKERSVASPLYALEAKLCLLTRKISATDTVLDEGIRKVAQSGNRGRLAELYWIKAQVSLMRKSPLTADAFLKQGQEALEGTENSLTVVHIICQRLLLRKVHPKIISEAPHALLEELNRRCLRLNRNQKSVPEFVIYLSIDFLKDHYPATVSRLYDYFPLRLEASYSAADEKRMLENENLRGLDKYREPWEGADEEGDEGRELDYMAESFL